MARWLCVIGVVMALAGACARDGAGPTGPTVPPVNTASLDEEDCVAPAPSKGADSYREVHCDDPAATGRVIERQAEVPGMAGFLDKPDCGAGTDLALDVTRMALATPARGFACVRNLQPPHPGDPGEGGGGIVEDDCLALVGAEVEETGCDGTTEPLPGFRVTYVGIGVCPSATDLSVSLEQSVVANPVDRKLVCAEALTPEAAEAARLLDPPSSPTPGLPGLDPEDLYPPLPSIPLGP